MNVAIVVRERLDGTFTKTQIGARAASASARARAAFARRSNAVATNRPARIAIERSSSLSISRTALPLVIRQRIHSALLYQLLLRARGTEHAVEAIGIELQGALIGSERIRRTPLLHQHVAE